MLTLEVDNDNYIFHGRSMQITKEKNKLLASYNKMVFNYGIVLMTLPTEENIRAFNQQIGNARFVRNDYLSQRNNVYLTTKSILSVAEYKKDYLPKLKSEHQFLKLSDKFALEAAIENVQKAFEHF